MLSVKVASIAGAVAIFATTAHAADMPGLPPVYPPQVEEFVSASGWYLRGDIGMTNQQFKGLHQRLYDVPGTTVEAVGMGWDSSMMAGLGIGYKFNDWFRADVTGEYRGKANFHGSDHVTTALTDGVDNYSGSKSEWVFMANAYVDLGTWWCVTPFIGAGVGTSYNHISGFRDDGVIYNAGVLNNSVTFAGDAGKWNLAWALHAGVGYKVSPNVTIELAYSYMNLGDFTTGANTSFSGAAVPQNAWTMHDVTSQDLKLGVRWNFDTPQAPEPMPMMPLVRKG